MKKLLNLDVSRTYQEKEMFQTEAIKEILFTVLFLWSKENKDTSYRQGMNEILAVLILSVYGNYIKLGKKSISAGKLQKQLEELGTSKPSDELLTDLYNYLHDESELDADLFYMFSSIMAKGIKSYYITIEGFKAQKGSIDTCPLKEKCTYLFNELLNKYDSKLYQHLNLLEVDLDIIFQFLYK